MSSSSCHVHGVGTSQYVDNTNCKLCSTLTWGVNPNSLLHDDDNNNEKDVLERLRLVLQTNS